MKRTQHRSRKSFEQTKIYVEDHIEEIHQLPPPIKDNRASYLIGFGLLAIAFAISFSKSSKPTPNQSTSNKPPIKKTEYAKKNTRNEPAWSSRRQEDQIIIDRVRLGFKNGEYTK